MPVRRNSLRQADYNISVNQLNGYTNNKTGKKS